MNLPHMSFTDKWYHYSSDFNTLPLTYGVLDRKWGVVGLLWCLTGSVCLSVVLCLCA